MGLRSPVISLGQSLEAMHGTVNGNELRGLRSCLSLSTARFPLQGNTVPTLEAEFAHVAFFGSPLSFPFL